MSDWKPARPTRRTVLAGLGGLAACGPAKVTALPPLRGKLVGAEGMARGHLLRSPPSGSPAAGAPVDVLIVGAGVSGLSAAWRLGFAKFGGTVRHVELEDSLGGTSASGMGPYGAYPWGAHYITMVSPEAGHLRTLLSDLGVITGFVAGKPLYDPDAVCFAPQERLFVDGQWLDGLWPEQRATAADTAQLAAWGALVASFSAMRGADGRPAFALPVQLSSRDPALRALLAVSFASWLDAQGFDAPALRWMLRYAMRDDFGAEPEQVSAWAGLHYHCSRRPDPGHAADLGTHVLTWPAGNGALVDALAKRSRWPVERGVIARQVQAEGEGVRVWLQGPQGEESVTAKHVILALPSFVAGHLMGVAPPADLPEAMPWRIVQLHVSALPPAHGEKNAWDSVIYESKGLGFVWNGHQQARFSGPGTMSWYEPWSAADALASRRELVGQSWEQGADAALTELSVAMPALRRVVEAVEVRHWGHGTVRPGVGVDPSVLASRARPHARVSLAHTDLSGMSLFEEASWHGVRAAEEALGALVGKVGPTRLVPTEDAPT